MQRAKVTMDLLKWVNELLNFDYNQITDLNNGVALVQIFHVLHPESVNMSRTYIEADSIHQKAQNFKILQQTLQKLQIDKEFVLANVIEKRRQDLFHLAQWTRQYFIDKMRERGETEASLGYNATEERSKATVSRKNVRSKKHAFDNDSDASSANTFGSSCISGRSSSTNYTSSYNRNRAARNYQPPGMTGFPRPPVPVARCGEKVFDGTKPIRVEPAPSSTPSEKPIPTAPPPSRTVVISNVKPLLSVDSNQTGISYYQTLIAVSALSLISYTAVRAPILIVVNGMHYSPTASEVDKESPHRTREKGEGIKNGKSLNVRLPFRLRRKMNLGVRKRSTLAPQDIVPSKGLLPIVFNFLDPTTWSNEVCKVPVDRWEAELCLHNFLDPPAFSPSVTNFRNLQSVPATPATNPTPSADHISLFPRFPLTGNESVPNVCKHRYSFVVSLFSPLII